MRIDNQEFQDDDVEASLSSPLWWWWQSSSLSQSSWRRILGGGGGEEPIKIDYNVLSVAAMTLALIMVVEVIRHRLDRAALHRPFFRAVLEGVYAECTCCVCLCVLVLRACMCWRFCGEDGFPEVQPNGALRFAADWCHKRATCDNR